MAISNILKKYRKENQLTQKELGKLLDINHKYISEIECGRKKLPKKRAQQFLLLKNMKKEYIKIINDQYNLLEKEEIFSSQKIMEKQIKDLREKEKEIEDRLFKVQKKNLQSAREKEKVD